jgi:hypothetical protein
MQNKDGRRYTRRSREERDGAMLLLGVFTSSPLFLMPSACKLAVDFQLRVEVHITHGGPTNRSAEKWSGQRNGFASLASTALRQQRPPTLAGAPSPRQHPGAPRLARLSPASRVRKAALTLRLKRGEFGADFCHLGNGQPTPFSSLFLHPAKHPFCSSVTNLFP